MQSLPINDLPMIRSPCRFLCEFLLVGAFLLLGWTYVSDLYLESLLGGVNLGLWFTNTSISLRSGESFTQGVACPDVVAAAALFAASSSRSLRWRLLGVAVSVSILWVLQGALIVLELHLVNWQMAGHELVPLIRDWSGPALVLMVWVGGQGSLLKVQSQARKSPGDRPGDYTHPCRIAGPLSAQDPVDNEKNQKQTSSAPSAKCARS